MSDSEGVAKVGTGLSGGMYLYRQPEVLDRARHGHLGICKTDRPFEFASEVRAVPIVASEILSIQKHYPVIFSSLDDPVLLAALGVIESVNLFVGDNGEWERNAYVPAYLRCHPVAYAMQPDNRFAVVIDRAADVISESPDEPFFEGGELSADLRDRVEFYSKFDVDRIRTEQFCARLKELELLTAQRAVHRSGDREEEEIASFVAVDTEKLRNLDKDSLHELFLEGTLAAILGHVFSVENWYRLWERRELRRISGSDATA